MKIISLIILNFIIIFFINKFRLIISEKTKLVDIPDNIRKFHRTNTPLLGGIMIYSTFLFLNLYLYLFNEYNKVNLIILIASSCCFLIGLFDDVFKISYRYKFLFLTLFFSFFLTLEPNLQLTKIYFLTFNKFIYLDDYSIFFTVICLLLLSNAINLIDGINGLCIIISLIIFTWMQLTFENINFFYVVIASLILILFLNLRNNIFLGDSGSLFLGSIIGLLLINSYNNEILITNFPVEDIFIVLMFPGVDMLRVFIIRIIKRKNPFSSDRNHLHHLLQDKKLELYKTLTIILALYLSPILINFFTKFEPLFIILSFILVYTIAILIIKKNSRLI